MAYTEGGYIRRGESFGKIFRKPDMVLMDGSLNAPEKYEYKTIIKGDEKFR